MIITDEIIEKGKSINGGWNKKQLEVIGVTSMTKGWKKRIIGKHISSERVAEYLRLKDSHLFNSQQINIFASCQYK